MPLRPCPILSILLAGAAAACAGGDGGRTALQIERDTIGDTIVVRTVAGQGWDADRILEPEVRIGTLEGEDVYMLGDVRGLAVAPDGAIYLYDQQVPALRKYAPDGTFIATFGRVGGGPGEYKSSDGGLAVLRDGRVLLRDPGNARISVFSEDGDYLDGWPLRGGYFTSRPLYVDTAGIVYTQIWGSSEEGERYSALQRIGRDGTLQDSLLVPEWDFESASVTFSSEQMTAINNVPFTPREHWTFSPHGYFVGGLSTEYSIDVFRPDGSVLRIQRTADPVPVDPAEREAERMGVIRNFQQMAPDWKWNGPPIPDTKPPFQAVHVASDGRIWVRLHQPGHLAEEADPGDPRSVDRWSERPVWDVFEPDGAYLGEVRAPLDVSSYPRPVFGPRNVWAVTTDELGVEYVTRFRISVGGNETAE
jgi:hypothetical protein